MTEEQKQAARDNLARARAAKNKPEEKTEPETAPTLIASPIDMTADEKAIFSRVASESQEWATIDPHATLDYALAEDPFKLPDAALKLEKNKEFKFKWISRKPERLDEVKNASIPFRWWPVNRMQPVAGAFDRNVDGTTGAVHLLDQMLVFKPWWMWQKEEDFQAKLADTRGDLTSKDGQEKNDLLLAAARRKEGEPKSRAEVAGNDIHFRGEADVDEASGRAGYGYASESDLVVNE